MTFTKYMRENCPNIPFIRKALTKARIKQFQKNYCCDAYISKVVENKELRDELVQKLLSDQSLVETTLDSMKKCGIGDEKLSDALLARHLFGITVPEYLCFHFSDREYFDKSNFISDILWREYIARMNDLFDGEIYFNKAKTYLFLSEYFKRDAAVLTSKRDYPEFLKFVKKHPIFVKKTTESAFGRGVEKLDVTGWPEHRLQELFDDFLVGSSELLLEELVLQSEEMSKYNASSVNTVRVITFITRDGIVAPFSFLKTGRDGSFVDNGGAGGILVGVDASKGELVTDGIDEKGIVYPKHPDTGIPFRGDILPEWDKAISLCCELASKMLPVKMVGWDIAHSSNGWVLIEANERSQIIGPQLSFQKGIKKEVLEIMSKMDLFVE